jgi:hypothetical protein
MTAAQVIGLSPIGLAVLLWWLGMRGTAWDVLRRAAMMAVAIILATQYSAYVMLVTYRLLHRQITAPLPPSAVFVGTAVGCALGLWVLYRVLWRPERSHRVGVNWLLRLVYGVLGAATGWAFGVILVAAMLDWRLLRPRDFGSPEYLQAVQDTAQWLRDYVILFLPRL